MVLEKLKYMIQQQTILKVLDNSGAKNVKCIKVLGGYKKKIGGIGNLIIVSVQNLRNKLKKNSKVKKGDVYHAIVLKTKTQAKNKDGSTFFFSQNAVSLLNKQKKPLASRILTPVPKKFKKGKFSKIVSMSLGTI